MRKLFLFSVFSFFIFSFSTKIFAATIVVNDISENTTWTESESPYVVSTALSVLSSATLTMEPGVVVKFDYGSYLVVEGILNASGTESKPIYFTSYYDDFLGGDTNGDGQDSSPYSGDWEDIFIQSTAGQSVLDHVISRYSNGGLVLYKGSSVSSDNFDSDQGITLVGSHALFKNLKIPKIELYNTSQVSVDTAHIVNPDSFSIIVGDNSSLSIKNSTVSGRDFGGIINIFKNSSATFDTVDIFATNPLNSSTGFSVFDSSSLDLNKSSIHDVHDGFQIFNNSSVKSNFCFSNSCEGGKKSYALMCFSTIDVNC